ncbi:ABC transporter permease subunit [Rubrobacter tropicus]|uniref:ABC transporter permease subunit n=1 Tax=Rubrobacter tropicus TaxID=2653851 RepID=A0A6G8QF02_9ACTN|nr:ABC transporter permease subunit [Rubrobacter tropicus]
MLAFLQDFAPESAQDGFIDWEWLGDNFTEDVVPAFLQHIFLCFVSLAIAILISVPLGILAARYRRIYPPLTALTGFFYTIPSFSMFTILLFVVGLSAGTTPAVIALVLYSLLVLIRNVVTGLDSVPPETKDAARGMGLTDRQILWRVELPLALPVIVAGMRIAIVTVIGIAVIGAYIGAGGLGVLIFSGIQRDFPTMYITGAVLSTLLAIAADLLFVRAERMMSPWARRARGAA